MAKTFVKELLISHFFEYADGREVCLRTFLCSARSYRKYIMFSNMPQNLKALIMSKVFLNLFGLLRFRMNRFLVEKLKGLLFWMQRKPILWITVP